MPITGRIHKAQRIGNNGMAGRASITNVGQNLGYVKADTDADVESGLSLEVGNGYIISFKKFVSVVGNTKFNVEII